MAMLENLFLQLPLKYECDDKMLNITFKYCKSFLHLFSYCFNAVKVDRIKGRAETRFLYTQHIENSKIVYFI